MTTVELGLDTFGDIPTDDTGQPYSYGAAIRQVVEEAVLADRLGVDVFTVGEHHRPSTRSPLRRSCSPRSPLVRRESASAPESRC